MLETIFTFSIEIDELLNHCFANFTSPNTLQKCLEKCTDALEPVLIVDCIREFLKALWERM